MNLPYFAVVQCMKVMCNPQTNETITGTFFGLEACMSHSFLAFVFSPSFIMVMFNIADKFSHTSFHLMLSFA